MDACKEIEIATPVYLSAGLNSLAGEDSLIGWKWNRMGKFMIPSDRDLKKSVSICHIWIFSAIRFVRW